MSYTTRSWKDVENTTEIHGRMWKSTWDVCMNRVGTFTKNGGVMFSSCVLRVSVSVEYVKKLLTNEISFLAVWCVTCNTWLGAGDDLHDDLEPEIFQHNFCHCGMASVFPSVLWHRWLVDRKGIRSVRRWMLLVCWWWWFDWSFARLIATVFTTISVTLSSNKIHSGG